MSNTLRGFPREPRQKDPNQNTFQNYSISYLMSIGRASTTHASHLSQKNLCAPRSHTSTLQNMERYKHPHHRNKTELTATKRHEHEHWYLEHSTFVRMQAKDLQHILVAQHVRLRILVMFWHHNAPKSQYITLASKRRLVTS